MIFEPPAGRQAGMFCHKILRNLDPFQVGFAYFSSTREK
jgi:hypothetical protein